MSTCKSAATVLCAALLCARVVAAPLADVRAKNVRAMARPELVLQLGPRYVEGVVWSRDGKTLASWGLDNTIKLWDGATGDLRQTLATQGSGSALAWSPDGKTIVVAVGGGQVSLLQWFDADSGALRRVSPALTGALSGNIKTLQWSPDGQTVYSAGESGIVRWWDARTGKIKRAIKIASGNVVCALSPDGTMLATSGEHHLLALRDAQNGKVRHLLEGHTGNIAVLHFSSDGKTLASLSNDYQGPRGEVKIWDAASGEAKQTLAPRGFLRDLAFLPDNRTLVLGVEDNKADRPVGEVAIQLWNSQTGAMQRTLVPRSGIFALSPDGKTLASVSSDGDETRLWDAQSGRARRTLAGAPAAVMNLAARGDLLASGHDDATARVWDMTTGRLLSTHAGGYEYDWRTGAIALSSDGRLLAASPSGTGATRTVRVWNTRGKLLHSFQGRDVDDQLHRIEFSRDGKTLWSAGTQADVEAWNIQSGAKRRLIAGHNEKGFPYVGHSYNYAFSPDGETIASHDERHNTRLWRLSGTTIKHILPDNFTDEGQAMAFSPDGKLLASAGNLPLPAPRRTRKAGFIQKRQARGSDFCGRDQSSGAPGEIRVWNVATGKLIQVLKDAGDLRDVVFSADGKRIVGSSGFRGLKVWDVRSGRLIRRLATVGYYGAPAWSRDGRVVACGANRGEIQLWRVSDGRLLASFLILWGSPEVGGKSPDWIAWTPEGFYDASPNASRWIRWRVAGSKQLRSAHEYSWMRRPDLLRKSLRGE